MIAVPTPFHSNKLNQITNSPIPNVDYIVDATKNIASYIRPGNLVLLESTSPVGTTDMMADILRKEGLDVADKVFKEIAQGFAGKEIFQAGWRK